MNHCFKHNTVIKQNSNLHFLLCVFFIAPLGFYASTFDISILSPVFPGQAAPAFVLHMPGERTQDELLHNLAWL